MKRKIIIIYLSLVMTSAAFGLVMPGSRNGTATQIIDPTWERTSNYILGDRGLRNYYGADPPGTWNWTNDAWNGSKSDLLYYDKVGPSLPPGYVFHSDQWFYTIDYDPSPDDPSTIYWFRTNLYIDSIGNITRINMFDKYSPNQPHIAVNDNIWVFVNGVYTQEARGTYQGLAAHIDWNLAPTTGWVDIAVEIPLSHFQQGNNEVAILYQEMIEDGGLGHLVFEIIGPPIADAGPDQIVYVGDTVFFDGTGSYDPDGTIVTYEWDFNASDGLWWETGAPPDGVGPTPTHIYQDIGIYTATLKVTDNKGSRDTDTCEIWVIELLPPTLYINISQDGRDVLLHWDPPSILGLDYYLIYRSTSQTNFDFNTIWKNTSLDKEPGESSPIPLRTMWNDTRAAFPGNSTNYEEQYYYTIRAVNILGRISGTSRTVGKWTKLFPTGISTFSLPLEPLQNITIDNCIKDMNANYIKWMHLGLHEWMKHGEGRVNDTQMKVGEGYEVKFASQTNYTFTGMPGAMISYDDDNGFSGFNHVTEAKNLIVSVEPNGNVNLSWSEPSSMNDGWYEVCYSNKRDGFFGTFNMSYFSVCPSVNFGNNTAAHINALANQSGARLYYMVVPFNICGVRGASTYSIGIWTEGYLAQYDTFGIPLKLISNKTTDWYCDNIPKTVGINYYNHSEQRWCWHSTRMPKEAYDPIIEMTEGYQISTSNATKFTFIGI